MFAPRQRGHQVQGRAPRSHAAGRSSVLGSHRGAGRVAGHRRAVTGRAGTVGNQAGAGAADGAGPLAPRRVTRAPVLAKAADAAVAAVTPPRGDSVIVGHRLANGYMSVHGLGQACGICDGAGPLPPRRMRARQPRVPDLEPIL